MKKNDNKAAENGNVMGNASQIDMIKEIIFGTTIRQFQEEFQEINEALGRHKDDQANRSNTMYSELSEKINESEKRVLSEMKKMHEELLLEIRKLTEDKTDRKQLGALLAALGNKLAE